MKTETVSTNAGPLQIEVPDCPAGTTPNFAVDRVQGPSFAAHIKPNQLYVEPVHTFYLDGSSYRNLPVGEQPTFTLGWSGPGAPDMTIVEPAGHAYPYSDEGSPIAAHFAGCLSAPMPANP